MGINLDRAWKKTVAIIGTLSVVIGMTYTVLQLGDAVATDKEMAVMKEDIGKELVAMNSAIQTNQKSIIIGQTTAQIVYWQEKIDRIELKTNKTTTDLERIKEYEREIKKLEIQLQQGGK